MEGDVLHANALRVRKSSASERAHLRARTLVLMGEQTSSAQKRFCARTHALYSFSARDRRPRAQILSPMCARGARGGPAWLWKV